MSKSKRLLIRASVVALALVSVVIGIVFAIRPSMPSEWRKIQPGMTREAALATLRDGVIDMRDLKGFDVTSRETTMLGASSYWQLVITYDASGRVSAAEAFFIHRDCGLFNTKPRSVL